MSNSPENLPPTLILKRGTQGRCPRCGLAGIFASHWRLHRCCPQCGLPLEMEDGWSYGSVPLAYTLACIIWVLPLTLLFVFGLLSLAATLSISLVGLLFIPIVTFRFTKGLWVGLYYAIVRRELRVRSSDEPGDSH